MFQQFANYLLGSITNTEDTTRPTTTTTTTEKSVEEGVENNNLKSFETDDEWILIDCNSEGNSEVSSLEDLNIDDDDDDNKHNDDDDVLIVRDEYGQRMVVTTSDSLLPLPSTVLTTATSLPPHISMEESWFLTPPPCFISTGPIDMHISPLENLLIEHPSMSVYTHHNRRYNNNQSPTTQLETGDNIDDDDDDDEVVIEDEIILNLNDNDNEPVVVVRRSPRRINHLQVLQQQQQQMIKNIQAQKVQVQNSYKMMQRNCLNRNNKAREVNSRNRRQRRGERSQGIKRSYANNNRKC